jgi:hypothetical protein
MKKIFLLSFLCTGLITTMPYVATALNFQDNSQKTSESRILLTQYSTIPVFVIYVMCPGDQVMGRYDASAGGRKAARERVRSLRIEGTCEAYVKVVSE